MRSLPTIRALWERGNFLGLNKAHGRVTVEDSWQLNLTGAAYGAGDRGPYRWWYDSTEARPSVRETEVPNIKSIGINRSLSQDAARCTITMYNQFHPSTGTAPILPTTLGEPGYYSYTYGTSPEAQALFGQTPNAWEDVLIPNALLRTYQGYGGWTATGDTMTADPIATAVGNGNIALTGTWLIDKVSLGSDGLITLECRDMAKLLLEQFTFTPLVPSRYYPLEYCRFYEETIPGDPGVEAVAGDPGSPGTPATTDPLPASVSDSNTDRWYPSLGDGEYWGTTTDSIVDGNPNTYSISVGTHEIDRVYNRNWWEIDLGGQDINEIYIAPHEGFGRTWISIFEDGAWQGAEEIPWDDANGDGRSDSLLALQGSAAVQDVDINFIARTGVTNGEGQFISLDRVYAADRVRVTTVATWDAGLASPPYTYRAALSELSGRLTYGSTEDAPGYIAPTPGTPAIEATPDTIRTVDGNILDWTDVVHDLLSWAGFLAYGGANPTGGAPVHALIQTSGTFPEECLTEELFDKKSIHDAILAIKEVLGYVMFVTWDGKVRFHSPNWWAPGNYDDNGASADVLTLFDEHTVVKYNSTYTDQFTRSEIVVGSQIPAPDEEVVEYIRLSPADALNVDEPNLLRGMNRPAIWIDEHFGDPRVQETMAAMIAAQLLFQAKGASVSAPCNPELQLNDQIFVYERVASEAYLHYIRGVNTTMDLDTGTYNMSITTNWLGDGHGTAINLEDLISSIERLEGPTGFGGILYSSPRVGPVRWNPPNSPSLADSDVFRAFVVTADSGSDDVGG